MAGGRSEREAEFVAFATARTPTLFRLALLLTGEWYAAEDLVQDTLATVYRRWGRVAAAANPAAYARATLVNTHLSARRRRSSTERPVPEPDAGVTHDPDPALRATLLGALARLEPADRAVVVLRFWEDLDVAATAELVGSTPTAVRARCHRALGRLRDLLGHDLHHLRTD
ncbi:MAG: SigE family RNA polymerase sigma factor [Nocardioidaceae bacterium]|nr:SigE family RNA polymerase sigma factor [Nocardioidaceae bacterium]